MAKSKNFQSRQLFLCPTQILTQNRKGAGGSGGGNRAGKHPTPEQICPESAKKPPPASLAAAHNPKVVGSNPAPTTKKALKSQDFRAQPAKKVRFQADLFIFMRQNEAW